MSNKNDIPWYENNTIKALADRGALLLSKEKIAKAKKNLQIKDAFQKQLKHVRLRSKEDIKPLVGKKAEIYSAPTNHKTGTIRAVLEPADVICIIYNLNNNSHVVKFIMANIKLMNNIDNWHGISNHKALHIPSLNQLKSWLSPTESYPTPESCLVDQLKMLYNQHSDDGTTIESLIGEGSYGINRTVFTPLRIGKCMFYGYLNMTLVFTIKPVPAQNNANNIQIKNKVRYNSGDLKGWKPDITLLASHVYNEIGSAIEFGAKGIAAEFKVGDTTIEVKIGANASFQVQQKISSISINGKIFTIEMGFESEYEILWKKCPSNKDDPTREKIPVENPFLAIQFQPEEISFWAALLGVASYVVYRMLDRALGRLIPLSMPPFILQEFKQRSEGEVY